MAMPGISFVQNPITQGSGGVGTSVANSQSINENYQQAIEEERRWSAEQAEINRQFQKELSDTAYKRAVKDLLDSGLNPALAYSQGGASSPAGAVGTTSAQGVYSQNDQVAYTRIFMQFLGQLVGSASKVISASF